MATRSQVAVVARLARACLARGGAQRSALSSSLRPRCIAGLHDAGFVSAPLAKSAELAPPQRSGGQPGNPQPRNAHDVRRDGASIDLKAKAIFDSCFRRIEDSLGMQGLQAPRELVWLNGAPGAGKGANTSFIQRSRLLSRAVCVSSLLAAEQSAVINAGGLVSDSTVVDALLSAILDPACGADAAGAVIDGFPRTQIQVDFLSLLYDKLVELHLRNADKPALAARFPRPHFRVVVLFVDEATSVARQLARGTNDARLRVRALDAGVPFAAAAARATDASDAVARARYHVFKLHYSTLLRLKERFPFTLVDACGSLADTEAQIQNELRYQSSMELSERAYTAVRVVPLAVDLVRHARRELVARLDTAAARHSDTLADVIALIEEQASSALQRAALAGHAIFRTSAPLFERDLAISIMLDVLSDRGFAVHHECRKTEVPAHFDLATGVVTNETRLAHDFVITYGHGLLRHEGRPRTMAPATLAVPSSEPRAEIAAARRGGVLATVAESRAVEQDATVAPPLRAPVEAGAIASTAEWHDEADVTEVVVFKHRG